METQEFYTVHGEDAVFIAREVFRTQGVIKYWAQVSWLLMETANDSSADAVGDKRLAYVVLSRMNFESIIKELLLVKRFRVEVFCSKSKGSYKWSLMYKVCIIACRS